MIHYKVNIVPGRKHKKEWATPDAVIIDDTPDVIVAWNKANGIGRGNGFKSFEVNRTIPSKGSQTLTMMPAQFA